MKNIEGNDKIGEILKGRSIFADSSDEGFSHRGVSPFSFGFLGDLAYMTDYVRGRTDSWMDSSRAVENFKFYAWNRYVIFLEIIGKRPFEKSFLEFVQTLEVENGHDNRLNWKGIWDFAAYISVGFEGIGGGVITV